MRTAFASVNQRVVVRPRPPWSVFDGPTRVRPGSLAGLRPNASGAVLAEAQTGRDRPLRVESLPRASAAEKTGAALSGDLRGFGLNVPVPTTHAGRIANKAVARLMWAKKPVRLRWESATGKEPYEWRIFAAPRARQHVLDVLKSVVGEIGQGNVVIRVQQDTRPGLYPDEAWYVSVLPGELAAPAPGDSPLTPELERAARLAPSNGPVVDEQELGTPASYMWAPGRYSDFGPEEWRSQGRAAAGGYADAADQPLARSASIPLAAAPNPTAAPTGSCDPSTERSVVFCIIDTFRTQGEEAGLRRARRVGLRFLAGARVWVDQRAAPEDRLAQEVAALRSRILRHRRQHPNGCQSCLTDRIVLMFLQERLHEVREALRAGETPPQAVADRADVPVTRTPRWVSIGVLALALFAAARGAAASAAERE